MSTIPVSNGSGVKALVLPPIVSSGRVSVGLSSDLPDRGKLVVDLAPNLTIGLFRIDGQLYAYENKCVHQGGPVCQGRILPRVVDKINSANEYLGQDWDEQDMHIVCPWHGFEYSIKTGEHAGDSRIHLRAFKVDESEGVIYVEL